MPTDDKPTGLTDEAHKACPNLDEDYLLKGHRPCDGMLNGVRTRCEWPGHDAIDRIEAIVRKDERERAKQDHCESCESNLAEDGQCDR